MSAGPLGPADAVTATPRLKVAPMQMMFQPAKTRHFCRSALMALALIVPTSLAAQTALPHDGHQEHDISGHMSHARTTSGHDGHAGHHSMSHNGKTVEMYEDRKSVV